MKITNKPPYSIGHTSPLSQGDITTLIKLFLEDPLGETGILGGRGEIVKTSLENDLTVIVKYYKRGGFLRHFIKNSYIRTGKTRPRLEFEMLIKARECGISTPEPIAWASCGGLIYRGLIATKEIENSTTIAEVSLSRPDKIEDIIMKSIEQVKQMIKSGIMHVDLHPGNILYDGKDVYVIDFDKSVISKHCVEKLTDFYIKRWKRAVKKHRLPQKLATFFEENLR